MGGGTADITNTIIANSKSSSIFVDDLSTINISYSLSNTDELVGINNIYDDPKFLNEYRLSSNSPAIDKGNPAVSTDPNGSFPDIGAYFHDSDDHQNLIINEIHYNPEEGESFEFIELVNAGTESLNLLDYKISGSVTHTFGSYVLQASEYLVLAKSSSNYSSIGNNVIEWEDGNLPNNYGVVEILDSEGNLIDRVDYENKYWWPEESEWSSVHHLNCMNKNWRTWFRQAGEAVMKMEAHQVNPIQ